MAPVPAAHTVTISLISHTNVGKTTLARTLLRRDVGEVLDQAHVTDRSERYTLIEAEGARLCLWDTPGLGNTVRLMARLRRESSPVGWLLQPGVGPHRRPPALVEPAGDPKRARRGRRHPVPRERRRGSRAGGVRRRGARSPDVDRLSRLAAAEPDGAGAAHAAGRGGGGGGRAPRGAVAGPHRAVADRPRRACPRRLLALLGPGGRALRAARAAAARGAAPAPPDVRGGVDGAQPRRPARVGRADGRLSRRGGARPRDASRRRSARRSPACPGSPRRPRARPWSGSASGSRRGRASWSIGW